MSNKVEITNGLRLTNRDDKSFTFTVNNVRRTEHGDNICDLEFPDDTIIYPVYVVNEFVNLEQCWIPVE